MESRSFEKEMLLTPLPVNSMADERSAASGGFDVLLATCSLRADKKSPELEREESAN
jgi:hypothetical protein